MIPLWLLTILHYASLLAAVLVLLLLAWQAVRTQNDSPETDRSENAN